MPGCRDAVRRVISGPTWAVATLHLLVLLGVAPRYGFHRDELYFVEAGRRLAFGYVDQPPLVPVLARLQEELFGASVAAIRVAPALVSAASVLLAAQLARELGAGRRAQFLAALAVAGAGFVLTTGHLLSTTTVDFAVWLGLLVVTVRLLRTGDHRWWLAHGGLAGIGLWNKHLVVLLTLSLLVGLVIERRFDLLRSWWLFAGGTLAVVIAAPLLVWQAVHGWPQLEMAGALADRIGGENRATLLPLQLLMLGPLLVPFGWFGIRFLRGRGTGGGTYRPLLWAWLVALAVTLASGGRPYYPLPLTATIVIAGIVAVEARWSRLGPALVGASALLSLPLALPLLPPSALAGSPVLEANDTLAEQIGWPELAAQVADVVRALPDEDVVVLTGSYGEAAALDRHGPALGLPPAHSGHNSYWHWRRPRRNHAAVVAVRMHTVLLGTHFDHCDQVATVDNRLDIDNEVHGAPIHVCRGLRGTWAQVWPAFRHYG